MLQALDAGVHPSAEDFGRPALVRRGVGLHLSLSFFTY